MPFATMLVLFALLPFLGGSSPQSPRAAVLLAAGEPAVRDAVGVVEEARDQVAELAATGTPAAAMPPVDSAFASAVGGGLFMFPAISLAPATAEALAAPIAGHPLFIHPVPGGETSPFGPRMHPVLGRPMFHTGIDLAATCGTPIHAAADGTVIYARVSDSWGGRTIIEHTPTLKTAYGHQSKFLVTEGEHVTQGQVIGLVGTTGWSTGCHLHFDVIVNDRYVDPAPYLGFAPSATSSVPYAVVPHLVLDGGGRVVKTVEDGDVPIPDASVVPSAPAATITRPASPSQTPPPAATSHPTQTSTPPPTPTNPPTTHTTPPPTTGTTPPPTTGTTPPPTGTTTTPPPATGTTTPPPATGTTTTTPPATTNPATTTAPPTTPVAAPPPA
ncbi:MAG: M23 family metallopeptidase, partial [Dermatophilaceae bacterium]|nr:M23 family metallopeptidase [Dermatophilaceae bacterium]